MKRPRLKIPKQIHLRRIGIGHGLIASRVFGLGAFFFRIGARGVEF
jgi:hypothetical protein